MLKTGFAAALLAACVTLAAGTARADELNFYSSDGPMIIDVAPGGQIEGRYRQDSGSYREGRMVGRMEGRGMIRGLWLQQESDHPCSRPREGARSWGQFVITNAWGPRPVGVWGYCGEEPDRSWNLRRR